MIDTGLGNIIWGSIEQGKKEGDKLALMIKDVRAESMKALVALESEKG